MNFAFRYVTRLLKGLRSDPAAQIPDPPQETQEPPEPAGTLPRPAEPAGDPRTGLEERCFQLGYKTARDSWALKPEESILKALGDNATALAHALHHPSSNALDERRIARLKAHEEDRDRRIADRDKAAFRLRAAQQRIAELGPRRRYPRLSPIMTQAAILALIVSISPTFHDLFTGLDSFMKWAAGIACAWGIALLIVYGILPGPPDNPEGGIAL